MTKIHFYINCLCSCVRHCFPPFSPPTALSQQVILVIRNITTAMTGGFTGQCTSHRKEISQHAASRQTSRDDHPLWTHSQHNQTRHLLPHAFWHCTACSRTHSASSPFPRPAIHTVITCKPLEAKQPCRSDPCASASFPRL